MKLHTTLTLKANIENDDALLTIINPTDTRKIEGTVSDVFETFEMITNGYAYCEGYKAEVVKAAPGAIRQINVYQIN